MLPRAEKFLENEIFNEKKVLFIYKVIILMVKGFPHTTFMIQLIANHFKFGFHENLKSNRNQKFLRKYEFKKRF